MLRNFLNFGKNYVKKVKNAKLNSIRLFSEQNDNNNFDNENEIEIEKSKKNFKDLQEQEVDFDKMDMDYIKEKTHLDVINKQYKKAVNIWKKPLEAKKRRKKRIEQRKAEFVKFCFW